MYIIAQLSVQHISDILLTTVITFWYRLVKMWRWSVAFVSF